MTSAENTRRGKSFAAEKARQTHCIHGHEFTDENTYITTEGRRSCRECTRIWQRENRDRRIKK